MSAYRLRRYVIRSLSAVTLGIIAAEILARVMLGLGDPPLTIRDPKIEYMFKPGIYQRFGNEVAYNEYSMRSPAPPKAHVLAKRVLVVGDSVVNGGAETDQGDMT